MLLLMLDAVAAATRNASAQAVVAQTRQYQQHTAARCLALQPLGSTSMTLASTCISTASRSCTCLSDLHHASIMHPHLVWCRAAQTKQHRHADITRTCAAPGPAPCHAM
jgi:hypothetical protein